jgi:hypothetical protein
MHTVNCGNDSKGLLHKNIFAKLRIISKNNSEGLKLSIDENLMLPVIVNHKIHIKSVCAISNMPLASFSSSPLSHFCASISLVLEKCLQPKKPL